MQTRRERILEILENSEVALTVEDISRELDISSKSVIYEDLEHISKSLKRMGKELLVRVPECGKCGFSFKSKIKKPTRCPKCKSSWIIPPSFLIREKH